MKLDIRFEGEVEGQDAGERRQLFEMLDKLCQEEVVLKKAPREAGSKDGGLIIGIAIASLAVNTVGVVVGMLNYWSGKRPKYTVSCSAGESTVTFGNLNEKELEEVTAKLRKGYDRSDIEVLVAKK